MCVEMQSESGQQKYTTEGVEMAYVGGYVVFRSVTEVSDDRLSAEKQVSGDTVDGGLTKALTRFAEMLIRRIDNRVHT